MLSFVISYSGWWLTYPSEKYDFVSWDDEIPNIWKNKTCSKPPNSIVSCFNSTSLQPFAHLLRQYHAALGPLKVRFGPRGSDPAQHGGDVDGAN